MLCRVREIKGERKWWKPWLSYRFVFTDTTARTVQVHRRVLGGEQYTWNDPCGNRNWYASVTRDWVRAATADERTVIEKLPVKAGVAGQWVIRRQRFLPTWERTVLVRMHLCKVVVASSNAPAEWRGACMRARNGVGGTLVGTDSASTLGQGAGVALLLLVALWAFNTDVGDTG